MIPAAATTGNTGYRHIERDDEPTLAGLRHAERSTSMELCRAYADLADVAPSDKDAMWNARRRVARHIAFWTDASDAYFAALAAAVGDR